MSLLATIKTDITAAVKSGETTKRNVLKVVVGEAEMTALRKNQTVTDEIVIATIKKVVEGNSSTIALRVGILDWNTQTLLLENEILTSYLPKSLTLDEVVGHLLGIKNELTSAKSIGQATGLAMKTLKGLNLVVDSKIVIEALTAIRG